jgi:hypothetical protein
LRDTSWRVRSLADPRPRLEVLRLDEVLLFDAELLLRLLEELLLPDEAPLRLEVERPPLLEASPPARATLSRVALLADARPRLEVPLLEDAFEVPELLLEALLEEERPPAADAPSPEERLRF